MLLVLGGPGCRRFEVCDDIEAARLAALPVRLSETGLYSDIATKELGPGVVPYTPRFPLWSDGAEKQRWIRLPDASIVDTANMDEWVFPEGTRVWKEFSVAGVPIETRLLEKHGPTDADWIPLAYVWDQSGDDAIATPLGATDAHATDHDVPAAAQCFGCHGGRRSFILGFSAIQLANAALPGELDLDGLIREGRLSSPPTTPPVVPGNPVEVAALGYFHGNCSHCHNQTRPERSGSRCFDPQNEYDFTLIVAQLGSLASTPAYQTVVGEAVEPGAPDDSRLIELMSTRGGSLQMPPLATEKVDSSAVQSIRQWIEGL
jgi:hypothetical protein